jgi:hypothetical protein
MADDVVDVESLLEGVTDKADEVDRLLVRNELPQGQEEGTESRLIRLLERYRQPVRAVRTGVIQLADCPLFRVHGRSKQRNEPPCIDQRSDPRGSDRYGSSELDAATFDGKAGSQPVALALGIVADVSIAEL